MKIDISNISFTEYNELISSLEENGYKYEQENMTLEFYKPNPVEKSLDGLKNIWSD